MIDLGHDPALPFMGYEYRLATILPKPPAPVIRKLVYTFNNRFSEKYIVNIEQYEHEVYILKFHLKKDSDRRNKYQLLTGKKDAGRVLATCIRILINEILDKNAIASFGFLGMNSEGEAKAITKRYGIYKKIVSDYFSTERFEHVYNDKKSAYALLNKNNTEHNLRHKVEMMFKYYYPILEEENDRIPPRSAIIG